jgi:putative endonuclease
MLASVLPEEPVDWKERLKELGVSRSRKRPVTPAAPPRSTAASTATRGRDGEEAAARHLESLGVRIMARNVRAEGSELDLIGIDRGTVLFVEVKRRRNSSRGTPAEAVTAAKRRRIVDGARRWLAGNRTRVPRGIRFDVVTIEDESNSIDWIQGAFDATFP